jgi:hypothetical protein
LGTPQNFAFKLDTMGIVNKAIEDRIGERRIADNVVQAALVQTSEVTTSRRSGI